ncbi:MAG: hypothetical protein ACLFPF_02585 [Halanaerobiales bacterium]
MIDIHSHVLIIDNGAETIGEAIVMLRIAEEQGVIPSVGGNPIWRRVCLKLNELVVSHICYCKIINW